MRLARIAALALCLFLSACQLMPTKGPTHLVHPIASVAYPDCRGDDQARFSYRKRLVFLRLDVKDRAQLLALHGIESRFAEALGERIDRNKYHPIALSDTNLQAAQPVDLHGKTMTPQKTTAELARRHRAQFVIAGEIIDMGQQQNRNYISRNYRKVKYLDRFANDPARMIVIRLDVYDGSTGMLLDHEVFKAWSKDTADLDRKTTLMGGEFMQSPLGAALDGLLEQQSEYVEALLSCIPMQAEVLRMQSSEQAVLSIGASQGLRPGDKFKVYRSMQAAGVHDQNVSQRLIGSLLIKDVYPEHALGQLEDDSGASLRQGDWVRAW